ncbi:uroporphyrinogen-III C-methyltransferase [Halomonas saccharevitans]|uniref:Uroporphyrinogen-III C-methyltransferase n=1 Tax=Halomonas saccharevitans TaxID=416872 RepID=A0ABU3NCT0_9GAMM|nr:uroporphyrinogen-III C-methyltransferase [Halomonas saccharevitans]MDT8878976.1 uroporphyrinogen-III C-methyltransferase [Halomonas saccharevitans]
MSKQPNDQDEQQTPSDAAQGASTPSGGQGSGEADKGGGTASRRSRRRGKGGSSAPAGQAKQEAAAPGAAAPSSDDAAASSSTPSAGTDQPSGQGGATETKSPSASADTPATGANASKTQNASTDKPASGGASAGKAKAQGAPGDKAKASDAGKPPAGGAATARRDGGQGGGKSGAVALVLVILLAIGVGFFGWQAWQKLEAQQQRLAALPADVASESALGELEGQLESAESERDAALESTLSSLRGEFADYRSSVDETLDKVLDELSREQDADERDWLHAEAAYLLRLANQRLLLERDVEGAAALLRTADARLREADNPALVPVRREIASELAALEAVPTVDRTGLYLALNAQQELIAGQPLAQDIEEMTADAAIEETPTGDWQQQLSRFGNELKDLVTVRKHDEALEALIAPEQESYLRQSVRLVLEQSQLALLKEEQALYEASLDKALTLVRGYYDTDASGVQSVIARLEELKQRSIRPELPDISGSQQALASFIEHRFESRSADQAEGGQGDDA